LFFDNTNGENSFLSPFVVPSFNSTNGGGIVVSSVVPKDFDAVDGSDNTDIYNHIHYKLNIYHR